MRSPRGGRASPGDPECPTPGAPGERGGPRRRRRRPALRTIGSRRSRHRAVRRALGPTVLQLVDRVERGERGDRVPQVQRVVAARRRRHDRPEHALESRPVGRARENRRQVRHERPRSRWHGGPRGPAAGHAPPGGCGGIRPTSLAAWAGRQVVYATGRIDATARALGMRSLDGAARLISWNWTHTSLSARVRELRCTGSQSAPRSRGERRGRGCAGSGTSLKSDRAQQRLVTQAATTPRATVNGHTG